MKVGVALLLATLLASPLCLAATREAIKIEPNEFSQSRADIEAAIRKTDRYSELTKSQREEMTQALDRMERTQLAALPSSGSQNAA